MSMLRRNLRFAALNAILTAAAHHEHRMTVINRLAVCICLMSGLDDVAIVEAFFAAIAAGQSHCRRATRDER